MKRNNCLIEVCEDFDSFSKRIKTSFIEGNNSKMFRNTIWYRSLLDAEKSCLKEDKLKKIHYKFQDDKEMVEEYNVDTQVLLRRAWKVKGKLGGEGKWDVEIGDPIPDATPHIEGIGADFMESKDQVSMTISIHKIIPLHLHLYILILNLLCIPANINKT